MNNIYYKYVVMGYVKIVKKYIYIKNYGIN